MYTPMTPVLAGQFAVARRAAELFADVGDHLLAHCPVCGPQQAIAVVRLRGMDGRIYEGEWKLSSDGFVWGGDSNGDGSSEAEIVRCSNCGLVRPLSDFVFA